MSEYQQESRSGWFGSFSLFSWGGVQAVIGALILLFTIGVFGLVIRDAITSYSKDKTGVRHILAHRWNERTLVFPIDGVDKSGRHARLRRRRADEGLRLGARLDDGA